MAVALANLDAVLLEARGCLQALPPHLLDRMEAAQKVRSIAGKACIEAVPVCECCARSHDSCAEVELEPMSGAATKLWGSCSAVSSLTSLCIVLSLALDFHFRSKPLISTL